jgi:hypothetical protein
MSFVKIWIELEIIMLSEISQIEKDRYLIPLICRIQPKNKSQDWGGMFGGWNKRE